jgi:hypothetical protein
LVVMADCGQSVMKRFAWDANSFANDGMLFDYLPFGQVQGTSFE